MTPTSGAERGHVDHIAFAVERPEDVGGAKAVGDGRFEIAADDNLGTRLVLEPLGYAEGHGRNL